MQFTNQIGFFCLAVLLAILILQILQIFKKPSSLTDRDRREISAYIEELKKDNAALESSVREEMAQRCV